MATRTGGIATKADCNGIAPEAFPATDDLTKCPTREEIIATGKLTISGSYADNQCVMYADIETTVPIETVQARFYFAGLDSHTISGVNVYAPDGTFISYADLGEFQDIPKSGSLIMELVGDNPIDMQAYGDSEGITITKGSGSQWLVSGYSFDISDLNTISIELFW